MTQPAAPRPSNPSSNVWSDRLCAGCGAAFLPTRTNQRHCRPSCRQRALLHRRTAARQSDAPDDRDGVAWGLFE
jgi:hypothetical protein